MVTKKKAIEKLNDVNYYLATHTEESNGLGILLGSYVMKLLEGTNIPEDHHNAVLWLLTQHGEKIKSED